jgi:multidrug efflux system outer membrane protein
MTRCGSLLLALAAIGCGGAAPDPKTPRPELPRAWSDVPSGATTAQSDPHTAWWKLFDDPVLDQLVVLAEQRNLDLRVAAARIREAKALRDATSADRAPQLGIGADASYAYRFEQRPSQRSASIGLDASWEPDLFGRVGQRVRAAESEMAALEADRDGVRVSLLAEVANAYLDYRTYRLQHDLLSKTAEAQDNTVRIALVRFEQGVTDRLDYERTLAEQAVIRSGVPRAYENAESARHRLSFLLATTPDKLSALLGADRPPPAASAQVVLLAPTQVVALRPDVRAAEQRLLAATASRKAAEALRYPQISLSALLGIQTSSGPQLAGTFPVLSLAGSLLAPLLDFGRIRAAIDVEDARQEQALLAYERTVRTAVQEAQTAVMLYTQGALRTEQLALAVTAGRTAGEIARKKYAEGTLSLIEVLDAERTLYQAELDLAEASAEVGMRLVSLYKTMGMLPPSAREQSAEATALRARREEPAR